MIIHLMDGTYELFRYHFGSPPRQDESGREVGATVGLVGSFLSLLRRPEVTHVAVAFDQRVESFRNDLLASYKTSKDIDPKLLGQFPLAEEICAAMGLVVWSMEDLEADDAMASAAAHWVDNPQVEQIRIASPDKDLAQCVVGDRVICWNRRTDEMMNETGVHEKFGIAPESIPDYLALVGDTADGIPGVPRWGAKSASTVLATYPHLEDIPRRVEDWEIKVRGAKTLAQNLWDQAREVLLYRQLATLVKDWAIPQSLDDLRWRGVQPEFEELLKKLGSETLLRRIPSAKG